jgi:hypothetical protein
MRERASQAYKTGMVDVSKDATILKFDAIDKALQNAYNAAYYKGRVKNANAAKAWEQSKAIVDEWKGLDPADFHTPEGMDALKQRLGDVVDTFDTEGNRRAKAVANNVYGATRNTIAKQAKTYSDTMSAYSDAAEAMRDIEKTLSLGGKTPIDTSLGKLQSALKRGDAIGERRVGLLEELGDETLVPRLAGQALSAAAPQRLVGQATDVGALLAAPFTGGASLLALPASSPRTIGELSYRLGAGTGAIDKVADLASPVLSPFKGGASALMSKYADYPFAPLAAAQVGQMTQAAQQPQQPSLEDLQQRYTTTEAPAEDIAGPQGGPAPAETPTQRPAATGGIGVRFPLVERVFGAGAQILEDGSVIMSDGEVIPPSDAMAIFRSARQ